jgi:hypothetical protein
MNLITGQSQMTDVSNNFLYPEGKKLLLASKRLMDELIGLFLKE